FVRGRQKELPGRLGWAQRRRLPGRDAEQVGCLDGPGLQRLEMRYRRDTHVTPWPKRSTFRPMQRSLRRRKRSVTAPVSRRRTLCRCVFGSSPMRRPAQVSSRLFGTRWVHLETVTPPAPSLEGYLRSPLDLTEFHSAGYSRVRHFRSS